MGYDVQVSGLWIRPRPGEGRRELPGVRRAVVLTTINMEYESSRIIDSNGDKYRIGWDEHGWFSIEEVELYPHSPEFGDESTIETDDGLMDVVVQSDYPLSFSPNKAEELVEAIKIGL